MKIKKSSEELPLIMAWQCERTPLMSSVSSSSRRSRGTNCSKAPDCGAEAGHRMAVDSPLWCAAGAPPELPFRGWTWVCRTRSVIRRQIREIERQSESGEWGIGRRV